MKTEFHRMFAETMADRFNFPKNFEFIEWSIVPDMRFYFDMYWGRFFHRFTMHGLANIDFCKEKGKKLNDVEYIEKHEDAIDCMLVSHNYLDVLNFMVFPSYPYSLEFKFTPTKLIKFFNSENKVKKAFEEIINDHNSIIELTYSMKDEYSRLPWKTGKYLTKILNQI